MLTAIEALRADPFKHGSVQLKGERARRMRVGDYRIIFEVSTAETMITIFRVAHRREAYR
ncbi:MAG: type II toxin-antitoxin system RelE/ParE family toxin [Deinococcota bacterium]|jgi:mRNA interferase RelE/StbE|nr:type II toxin-antitoxin system RelE/ParE family toxin [Deinococcota bacterium]